MVQPDTDLISFSPPSSPVHPTVEEVDSNDFTARDYQDELLAIAMEENVILYLPTGSGKTFIATMLIKYFSGGIEKKFSDGGKRAFFLVNTVALVSQQSQVIKRHTSFNVGQYSGDMNVDLWTVDKWMEELEDNSVIVMTAQILLNMLQHYYIKLHDIKVIVFDECHRAVKDHPMRSIMKYFENVPVADQPRVLGLTGSLLNSTVKVHQVSTYIRDIETTFLSRIITAKDDDMANKINKFSTDPIEHLIFYKHHSREDVPFHGECKKHFDSLKSFLLSVLLEEAETDAPPKPRETCVRISDELKVNKRLCNLMEDVLYQMADLGMYGGFKATLAHIIQLERLKRNANNSALVSCLQSMITTMTLIRKILGNAISENPLGEAIMQFSTHKIVTLVDLLKQVKLEDSVIIFVERRFTCKVIFYILQDLTKAGILPNVRSDFIVGYNNNPFNDTREGLFEKKLNKDVLKKFNSGGTNVLVASDVLEEGIDVQSCNYVIEFNPPRTARSYIQSKGRARKKDSKYFIMVSDNDLKFANESYKLFQELEEVLKRELVGKFIHRTPPSQEELDQSIFNHAIEPYYPRGPDGPMIAAAAAISLLNRYCSSLHVDYFTKLTLYLWKEKLLNGKIIVRLQFPNASPVREIIRGKAMESMDLAKRSAALEGCKILYEYKELNDHLLPRGRSSEAMEDVEMFPNWSDEESDNDSAENCEGVKTLDQKYLQPGTKKRKRLYLKKYPESWTGCRPVEDSVVYMHVIHIHPNYPVPENSRRRVFYELLKSDNEFAILSSKPMPRMAEFPLFMSTGEVRISFTPSVKVLHLTEEQISQIVNFHSLLFENILCTVHPFMYHDSDNLEQSFLIAPVRLVKTDEPLRAEDHLPFEINWEVVVNNQSLPVIEPLSKEVRKSLRVTKENYDRCVVVPWYRGFAPRQAYIVTAISDHENAHSPFPSDEFDDYVSYFVSKYSTVKKLYSPDEMLLEVRTVSSRLNCLRPRTISYSTSKRRRKDEEEFEETLVAELCVKFDVPGVIWLKATLLPSILHRFTYLLLAEELKNTITDRLIEEIDEVDSLCLRGAKTGYNSLLPDKQLLKNGSLTNSQLSPRKKVKLEPSDYINDGIDCLSNFNSQDLGLEDLLLPLEIDQMSMVENDDDLFRTGPTAKTVTIKPKTTLPIKIEDPIYPWRDEQEPIDFQRHIDEVKLIDIYFFDDFISKPLTPVKSLNRTKFVKADYVTDTSGNDIWSAGKIKPPSYRANFPAPSLTIFQHTDKFRIAANVQQNELIRVLTAASAHDVFNLERLETLGDSFLKYSVSLILYLSYPRLTEGQLTSLKGKIIGNRNLFYCGRKFQFGSIVKVTEFNTERDWVPPGFCIDRKLQQVMRQVAVNPRFLFNDCCSLSKEEQVSGQLFPETIKRIHEHLLESQEETDISNLVDATFLSQQLVTDKTIADCVEALLGLYIKNCGLEMGFHLLKLLGVMKRSIITTDIYRLGVVPSSRLSNVGNIDFHLHNPCQLERLINYRFNDRSFLLQALSHPTYQPNNITPTYQRLEFLGDAILDFLITTHIFESCSKLTPGELTDLRSALVNNITLATISVRIGLHKYLLMRSCKLSEVIDMFVQRQEERQHEVDDQVLFLIEEEDIRLAEAVEVPKVLGDIFESLVAAIFLDSGKCLKTTWNFIYKSMRKEIEAFSGNVPKNHVRLLYEENVSVKFSRCTVIEEFGCVMVPVKIFYNNEYKSFHGFGETKAQAKRAAAKLALRHIHS